MPLVERFAQRGDGLIKIPTPGQRDTEVVPGFRKFAVALFEPIEISTEDCRLVAGVHIWRLHGHRDEIGLGTRAIPDHAHGLIHRQMRPYSMLRRQGAEQVFAT